MSKSFAYFDYEISKRSKFLELTAANIRDIWKLLALVIDIYYILDCSLSKSAKGWSDYKFYKWYKRNF